MIRIGRAPRLLARLVALAGLAFLLARPVVQASASEAARAGTSLRPNEPSDFEPASVAVTVESGRLGAQDPGTLTASLQPSGHFEIRSTDPAWTFGGEFGHAVSALATSSGQDALGAFDEVSFEAADAPRHAAARTYAATGVVLFSLTYAAAGAPESFPALSTRPVLPFSQSYRSIPFSPAQFNRLSEAADSPWLFFDGDDQAYLVSAADNFLLARSRLGQDGSVSISLDSGAGGVPAGFTQRAVLVLGHGIQHVYQTWGHALTAVYGKARPANDADLTLSRLGYWTDNGATYYYRPEPSLGYADTLLAVRDAFNRDHVPLGYVQLDSWFYPKGARARWDDMRDGIYRYEPAPELFPDGLAAFQRRLGLPLVTHARWVDPASPYRSTYAMSGNVVTDPRYWDDRLGALASAGVVAYEQDWLGAQAQPDYNLSDPQQFLSNMASAAARNRLSLQYCMPLPRHYLQSALYGNLTSIRVSDDRFERGKWDAALYDSQLASALGIWPWDDVFMSSERDNLLLATLSAGVVGIGDPVGAQNVDNLRRTMRSDGVLVKPDVPLAPTDATYVAEAQGGSPPMVAATWSQHGLWRDLYVFAYPRAGDAQTASFSPSALGLDGPSYVYAPDGSNGTLLDPGAQYLFSLSAPTYFVVAPIGPSGIALLGDAGRFVPLGRARIGQLADDGVLRASVEFAAGEGALTLRGYAPQPPSVVAEDGTLAGLAYEAATGLFTFSLAADAGRSSVELSIGPVP